MAEWIKPTNTKYYNHWGAYQEFNEIYWRDRVRLSIGDIVYLYSSLPEGRITHKCIVTESNVNYEKASKIDDSVFFINKKFE